MIYSDCILFVAVVIQFTVFKHSQMICESMWKSMDVSVFSDKCTIHKTVFYVVHLYSFNAAMVSVVNRLL